MIKTIFQITFLITQLLACNAQWNSKVLHKPNYIDSIKNAKQITDLLFKIDNRYQGFKVNQTLQYDSLFSEISCERISDSLKVKAWQKCDFDNNGLSDLLVVGTWSNHYIICILDKGQNKYEMKPITRRIFQECTFPVVENDKINYYFKSYYKQENRHEPGKLEHITLIYKFGDFIEENLFPSSHQIEKIEYSTTGCFGSCPIFSLIMNSNRNAGWHAEQFNKINNKEIIGNLTAIITEEKYNEIVQLLNYINFEKLNDNYAVTWTDDQTSVLKITYDNGKTKSIRDYGLIGTFGLDRIYQLLFELRQNQNWIR
jgi:hypothetical protein